MTNVGVIGLGMMGLTHLDVYAKLDNAHIVAIADKDPARLSGESKAAGNVEGQAQGGVNLSTVTRYDEGMDLITDPNVSLVDICLPTPMHLDYARAAIEAGKHVMVEKPAARTAADAFALAELAERSNVIVMPGMCMRFWPGWDWLKQVVDDKRYGRVRAAHFRRVTSHPGGPFYSDGEQCGGAILDLHIHDTDFVHWLFGIPAAVSSHGYSTVTGKTDHVVTQYLYEGDGCPDMVVAEGSWAFQAGFGFSMQYTVNFERATAVFDLAASPALRVIANGSSEAIALSDKMGYAYEIEHLLQRIAASESSSIVTMRDAAQSVAIVEAEVRSIEQSQVVHL